MKHFLVALPTILLLAPAVLSAEAPPAPPAFDSARDLEIQVRARHQLQADDELASFNLGVTVRNGVAVVWGPVSSPQLREKAMKKIENVRGIYQVRSEMYVSQTAGLLLPQPGGGGLLPDAPEQSSSAMPDWRTGQLPPLVGRLAAQKIGEPPPKLVALLPPVAAPDEGFDGNLAGALEKIRKGDERYRSVLYEIKNGAIYLRGPAKPENVMAFARAISNLPGVERVVVQSQANPR